MILKHKLFEKYDEYIFKIPSGRGDRILVNTGEMLKEGTDILVRRGNNVKNSFFLPSQLGCAKENIGKYLMCMDGEFVEKGDILAEKTSMGGLTIKRLTSPIQGVVDMSRIGIGYLDLLGEEQENIVKSTFNGVVESINPIDGITIKASAYALDLVAISNVQEDAKYIVGEFVSLGSGNDVILRSVEEDLQDKIVFAGKRLHPGLLRDIFEKGAKFVLSYSMDYQNFRNQGLPVGVIGGFGEIYSPKEMIEKITKKNHTFAVVDVNESQIFFLGGNIKDGVADSLFVQSAVGRKVISHALGNYGMLGEVNGVEDDSYLSVNWENGASSIINVGSVEFVSY